MQVFDIDGDGIGFIEMPAHFARSLGGDDALFRARGNDNEIPCADRLAATFCGRWAEGRRRRLTAAHGAVIFGLRWGWPLAWRLAAAMLE